jgi:hypothetical protein
MDTREAAKIIVYKHNGDKIRFVESGKGLYYFDTAKPKVSAKSTDYSFINSVVENKAKCTTRQVNDAVPSWWMMRIGH